MRPLLIKVFFRVCALFPLPVVHLLGACMGTASALLPGRMRRVSRINIEMCLPELKPAQRRRILRRSLVETGKTVTETGPLWYWRRPRVLKLVRELRGIEALEGALAANRGAILAIPHLGSWEMVGLYCSAHHPMTSLYRPPRMEALGAHITHARERFGARLVPAGTRGVRALHRALANGEVVAILPDQEPKRGAGAFAPFFGHPAYTMTLLARLIKNTGAPVFFTYAERLPRGAGFRLHFVHAPQNLHTAEVEPMTAMINQGIESCVRGIPEQYQWSYKRFNTRPEGERGVY